MEWYLIKTMNFFVGHCAREWTGKHTHVVSSPKEARHFSSYQQAQEHAQQFQYGEYEIVNSKKVLQP